VTDSGTSRLLVLGAGAIGGLLASRLAANPDVQVSVAVRRPTPAVTFVVDGQESRPAVRVVSSPDELDIVDWVVVATKAYDVSGLAPWLTAGACAGAHVAVAQNGVEQVDRVAPYVDAARVMPVIVTYGAERPEPGRIVQTLEGTIRVPADDRGRDFAAVATPTGLIVEVVDDFVTALWTKLAWNLVGNSLSTITDLPVREIGVRPELRRLAELLVAECRTVAATQGARLEPDLAAEMLAVLAGYPTTVRSSMWQDRDAGRPFEHDAISGAVVRAARRGGLSAPYSLMATELLETLSTNPTM
jgi:2-dehydropantoate 2-reductase